MEKVRNDKSPSHNSQLNMLLEKVKNGPARIFFSWMLPRAVYIAHKGSRKITRYASRCYDWPPKKNDDRFAT